MDYKGFESYVIRLNTVRANNEFDVIFPYEYESYKAAIAKSFFHYVSLPTNIKV